MVRAVTPIPFVKARFFDRCGKPLAGGKVYTYEANTTTAKTTYKDPCGLTPNTNPIILDAAGEADIYLDGTYRIRITDRNDVLINDVSKIGSWFSDNLQDTLDNISGAMDNALKPVLQNLDETINIAAAAGAGANGWTAMLVTDGDKTQAQINANQKQTNDNYLSKLSNELYVDDYIAKAATIRDGFIAALTDLKNSGGGTLNLGKAKSYLVFTSTSGASTNILDFDQLKNVTINFNGSEIVVDTSNAQVVPRIFNLKNPKNITFNDVRVRDVAEQAISGTSPPNHWGPDFVRITTDDTVATKDKGGIVINNIDAYSCDAVIVVDGYNGTQWQTQTEFKDIKIAGRVKILNCYYGACFINAGDDFSGVLHGENVRRLYYPCGVKNHIAVVTNKGNGLSANAGSTANVLLKSGDRALHPY